MDTSFQEEADELKNLRFFNQKTVLGVPIPHVIKAFIFCLLLSFQVYWWFGVSLFTVLFLTAYVIYRDDYEALTSWWAAWSVRRLSVGKPTLKKQLIILNRQGESVSEKRTTEKFS
ncbi:hypothetical protein KCM76_21005 [Zooshikella marina]|uniref:VirB3 family type IV secretion system protein n=1 Tax=Zooshikella ganghwensis TaxID=202772 RepID=UPI001BAF7D7D|nr:VirB3 family type IV secretion system protein [Zooshikella ganghwensis]MBU2708485.1 hypothetical protein [Zooshikella ganghwensis]